MMLIHQRNVTLKHNINRFCVEVKKVKNEQNEKFLGYIRKRRRIIYRK